MSAIAALFALHLRADKLPPPVPEYLPFPDRKFRIDFAWPAVKFAVEVDGEVHRIKARFHSDIEKHALLAMDGWVLLRVGGREVRSGVAVMWTRTMLARLGVLA